jgi:uncharacterized protein
VKLEGEGKLLRLFVGESDTWHGSRSTRRSSSASGTRDLRERPSSAGSKASAPTPDCTLRGSSACREDLPVVIEIVDTAENVDRILPMLDEMVQEGLLTVERVQVVSYRGSKKE